MQDTLKLTVEEKIALVSARILSIDIRVQDLKSYIEDEKSTPIEEIIRMGETENQKICMYNSMIDSCHRGRAALEETLLSLKTQTR